MKYRSLLLLIIAIMVSAIACTSTSDDSLIPTYVAETAAAREAATAQIEQALSDVLTASAPPPSLTPTPTATATPTETPTPSPTPNPIAEVIVELAQIREGPGIEFPVIRNAALEDTFEVVGRSEDGRWLVVSLVMGELGWVFNEEIKFLENVEALAIVESPPTPQSRFTITVINNLDIDKGRLRFTYRVQGVDDLQYNTYVIPNGESISIELSGGYYKFSYSHSGRTVSCSKTFVLNFDIYWVVTGSGQDFCASFP